MFGLQFMDKLMDSKSTVELIRKTRCRHRIRSQASGTGHEEPCLERTGNPSSDTIQKLHCRQIGLAQGSPLPCRCAAGCGIKTGMEACLHPQRKRHAQLRHQPRAPPLWVGDPDDWALVRRRPRPPLVCPEPGCNVELISYENLQNQYNPRIFKFKADGVSCSHWDPSGFGGGPESSEHEWMKLYLSRIATSLGYTATPEHSPTRADVFVHECSFCLEVQLRSTQFRKRTATREAKGAHVCWLIREGLDTEISRKALFGLPAVRFRIVDGSKQARLVAPWDEPDNHELNQLAQLQVFGTVAYVEKEANAGSVPFRTRTMDGKMFLEEILSGKRRWYRPNMLGRKSGLWALRQDVSSYFAHVQRAKKKHRRTRSASSPHA